MILGYLALAARISWEGSRFSHNLTRMSEFDPGLLYLLRTALGQIDEQLTLAMLPT